MGSLQDEMKDLKRREPRYYVVKAGDSLSKIAKEMLGDADRWPEIVAANKDRIDDPDAIEPGLKLKMPS
jgi:nucleoid-associated protein YgaU